MVKIHHHNNSHTPVLLEAVINVLEPKAGESYLDLTAGYGGHASAILESVRDAHQLTLVDRDSNAIASLQHFENQGARLIHKDFERAASDLIKAGEQFDMILLDLGVSSPHLDNPYRGFSFQNEAPLDMRMNQQQELTAADIVNSYDEDQLTDIIRVYGEDPAAKRIAKRIIDQRPFHSTTQLAESIQGLLGRRGRIHPATRTFQALRIAVNDELGQLSRILPKLPRLLKSEGRLAIISFHSLEDRLVKKFFAEQKSAGYEAELRVITKKPISGRKEDVFNRRARSAQLRAAIKIKM